MAQPQKFIKLSNGRLVEEVVESISSTSGATDANKLIVTTGDGKIDPSLLPTGVAADTLMIVASETLSAGDFVNIWDDTGVAKVRKADASMVGKEADGFVTSAVTSGQSALVYFEGRNSGLTSLTLGARYYLGNTPGTAVTTVPSGAGHVVQYLGRATTTTSLVFEGTDGVILA